MLAILLALAAQTPDRPVVEMNVYQRGVFEIELMPDKAPKTVAHFLALVDKGFYNGILFHRVVDNWVAQAGDPLSKTWTREEALKAPVGSYGEVKGLGDGGSGTTIPFEDNDVSHQPGTVGMALESPASDTGDSQFFINLADNKRLDHKYCVFGKVTVGLDKIKTIRRGDPIVWMRRKR
ncbi:MAG TPA: peptidylprolyl isomerase [Fimbriimonadaceae bacterium]|nr:peptidylprolyl isomerase [Fimbriimonadaceae bacterium]